MTQEIIKAKEVIVTPEAITIHWEDGRICVYEHRFLRLNCRCAGCVGEWPNRAQIDPSTVPDDVQALDHQIIGSYAVQFLWTDTPTPAAPSPATAGRNGSAARALRPSGRRRAART